jgi:hypothetical protein
LNAAVSARIAVEAARAGSRTFTRQT